MFLISILECSQCMTPLLSLLLPVTVGYVMSKPLKGYFGSPKIAISKHKNFRASTRVLEKLSGPND